MGNFPTLNTNERVRLKLKAVTKKLVTIAVNTTKLKEGYFLQVHTEPSVYLGESLVAIRDGKIRFYCIHLLRILRY